MVSTERTLEAIKFDRELKKLEILDQLLLPYSTTYIQIKSVEDAFSAIKLMQVRGAPAIAIVGVFAVVVDTYAGLQAQETKSVEDLEKSIDYLISSRPTAVNLSNALNEVRQIVKKATEVNQELFQAIYEYAIKLFEDDLSNNFKIGNNGLQFITQSLKLEGFTGPFSIITICNTGSLATSGHGTALGIIRSTYQKLNKDTSSESFYLDHVYPCETRPYNQGAKLTTYELNYENIPFTLICDNMVSSLINSLNKQKKVKESVAPVKFIIIGADRIVKNGDTANKIGSFQLATIANYFNNVSNSKIKFIVAAPKTTIDMISSTGDDIIIEERPSNELTTITAPILNGNQVGEKKTVGIATPGISVWNPAFDVTPHQLIDSIVTEGPGVFVKDDEGNFNLEI